LSLYLPSLPTRQRISSVEKIFGHAIQSSSSSPTSSFSYQTLHTTLCIPFLPKDRSPLVVIYQRPKLVSRSPSLASSPSYSKFASMANSVTKSAIEQRTVHHWHSS